MDSVTFTDATDKIFNPNWSKAEMVGGGGANNSTGVSIHAWLILEQA